MPNPPSLPPYSPSEVAEQLRGIGDREGEVLLVHTSYPTVRSSTSKVCDLARRSIDG